MGFPCHTADAEKEGAVKIIVNAMSIKIGGALVLLKLLISEMAELRPDIHWHLVLNPGVVDLPEFQSRNVTFTTFPDAERSPLHNSWFYLYSLPRLVKDSRADVLFSLTNYLPGKPQIPSFLLVHHAGYFSELFWRLHRGKYPGPKAWLAWQVKKRRVFRSVKDATMVTVQTESMAGALCRSTGIERSRVRVIPHGPGICKDGAVRQFPRGRTWRIGYLTNYGVQKNFIDLFHAVALLVGQGHAITLVLTLDKSDPLSREVLLSATDLGIEACLENHGQLQPEAMHSLYDSLDLFVFPSLCESFGFPMLEAMVTGIPLIVSGTEGNLEVVGAEESSYPPGRPDMLAEKMALILMDRTRFEEASLYSLQRAEQFTWRKSALMNLAVLENLASTGDSSC